MVTWFPSVDPPWRTTCKHQQCGFRDISESRIFNLVHTTIRAQRSAAYESLFNSYHVEPCMHAKKRRQTFLKIL